MALPEGYSFTRPSDRGYTAVMPPQGMRYAMVLAEKEKQFQILLFQTITQI
jgi:hypothetical protein